MNRLFEILDEIIDSVESAKGVPMSSSCVINRAALLDQLDDLRDAFPQSVEDAREIIEQRDDIVESARTEAERVHHSSTTEAAGLRTRSVDEAERLVADARANAEASLSTASQEADRVVKAAHAEASARLEKSQADADGVLTRARSEHDRLVSDHEIHQGALRAAEQVNAAAQDRATKLKDDADTYVENSLISLGSDIQKLLRTVETGRDQVRRRRTTEPAPDSVYDQRS